MTLEEALEKMDALEVGVNSLIAERDALSDRIDELEARLIASEKHLLTSKQDGRQQALDGALSMSWTTFHNCDELFEVVSVSDIEALKQEEGE